MEVSPRTGQQGPLRRVSSQAAALNNLEFPSPPSPQRPWENQPHHSSPLQTSTTRQLGQVPWGLHTDGISGTSSGSRISANSSVPPSEPSSGKSPGGWVQTSRGPEAPGLGLNHLRLEFNCPTSPLTPVACLAGGLFLHQATSGPGSQPSRRKRWSEARGQASGRHSAAAAPRAACSLSTQRLAPCLKHGLR